MRSRIAVNYRCSRVGKEGALLAVSELSGASISLDFSVAARYGRTYLERGRPAYD